MYFLLQKLSNFSFFGTFLGCFCFVLFCFLPEFPDWNLQPLRPLNTSRSLISSKPSDSEFVQHSHLPNFLSRVLVFYLIENTETVIGELFATRSTNLASFAPSLILSPIWKKKKRCLLSSYPQFCSDSPCSHIRKLTLSVTFPSSIFSLSLNQILAISI